MVLLRRIARALLLVVGGFLVGTIAASWFWRVQIVDREFATHQAGITARSLVLDQLNCGNVAAARKFLDLQLDGDLIATAQMVRDGRRLDAAMRSVVEKILTDRKASGYEPMVPLVAEPLKNAAETLTAGKSASANH